MILRTEITCLVGAVVLASSLVAASDIFLVMGQSNASGRGELPAVLTDLENVSVFDGTNFVPAQENVNVFSTVGKPHLIAYSFAYTFGATMTESLGGDEILLVSNARGGTKIRDWLPGEIYYTAAVERMQAALASRPDSRLAGVLWHQGEGDSNNRGYTDHLQTLINGLRSEFNDNSLPFIAGELSYGRGERSELVNGLLNTLLLEGTVNNFGLVSAAGLTASDGTHFDTESLQELGRRYAGAMLETLDADPVTPPTAPRTEAPAAAPRTPAPTMSSRAATDAPVALPPPQPADNVGVIGLDLIVLPGGDDGGDDATQQPLTDGMVLSPGRTFNIAARTAGDNNNVAAVTFGLNDEPNFRRESVAPYAMCGDSSGSYAECELATGTYTVTATAVSEDNETINQLSVTFVVE